MFALIERDLSAILKVVPRLNPIPKNDGVNPYWVSLYDTIDDQSITKLTVLDDYTQTIYSNKVERVRIKRDLTAQEIDDLNDKLTSSTLSGRGILKALAISIFTLVNEVKTLKSEPQVTPDQFKNYLKGLID